MNATTLTVNGTTRPHHNDLDLPGLIIELLGPPTGTGVTSGRADGAPTGVAVAINGAVVPRSQWSTTVLQPGDRIEIVGAVQGG